MYSSLPAKTLTSTTTGPVSDFYTLKKLKDSIVILRNGQLNMAVADIHPRQVHDSEWQEAAKWLQDLVNIDNTKREALEEFIECIDATGGLTEDEERNDVPVGDPEWIDLAYAYKSAKAALGRL